MKLSKRQRRERRSAIIRQLCELSRDGWANAKPYDYKPLEDELDLLGDCIVGGDHK